jgi:hypothetical protein
MTSKNSFWANSLENQKRRIWVWVVAVLTQLLTYVGVLTVYLSRIRYFQSNGSYRTTAAFHKAMVQAAQDALGFQNSLLFSIIFLAVIIGGQGFSYLNDRRKVDMYHSVPVSKTKRFFVIYINGILIYLISTVVGLLTGILLAAAQGAMSGTVLVVSGIAFVWHFLYFLVAYHTMILAVMLTGNTFISLCAFVVLTAYEPILYMCIEQFRYSFYQRYSRMFLYSGAKLSAFMDFDNNNDALKWMDNPGEILSAALPYMGKWLVIAVCLFAAVYLCYAKRRSEAAGKALAFEKCRPVVKVMVVVEAAMLVGSIVKDAAYYSNELLILAGMVVSAILLCGVLEVVYEFDIKCILKHWVSSLAAVCCVLVVFSVYKFDLLGFDSYVPEADKVESMIFQPNVEYPDYWDDDFQYVSDTDYLSEHMYLTDTADVLALVEKDQQEEQENMGDPRGITVVYRMKSGRKIERCIRVDFDEAANEELLNRIIGSKEYREGMYQIAGEGLPADSVKQITYTNGATYSLLPAADAEKLMEAYVQDLESMDYTLLRNSYPCGSLTFNFGNYRSSTYNVYETYHHVLAYLKEQGAYYPVELNAEDINSITITNYHNEVTETDDDVWSEEAYAADTVSVETEWDVESTSVVETFYDQEQIAQILPHIHPSNIWSNWHKEGEFDANYEVDVEFKSDSSYPYNGAQYYFYYEFFTGQVPDFVVEATALQ